MMAASSIRCALTSKSSVISWETVTAVSARGTLHPQLARFSEKGATPGNFTVLIDWGDQTAPTSGQVRKHGNGKFIVVGTHRYLAPGTYQVMTMIQDQSGQEVDPMSTVTVTGKVKAAHR